MLSGFRIETDHELAVAMQRLGELSPTVAAQQAEFNQLLAAIDAYQSRFLSDQERACADTEIAAEGIKEGRLVDPEVVHGWMKKFQNSTKN
ncbi:hypothetical protein [Pseudidiomarina aestuarii]|uniref:hypothetical protein n=1 Tax=Pseudidiomarina aestuarii TaxID=624146 RepID=UPI003A972C52